MLTLADRKRLYNRCNPLEALDPEDDRNVDLDASVQAGGRVRGVVWVERLAQGIELSDRPVMELFTGLPGSGKSTELRRLARQLERADGANLLPVVVDAEDTLDLTSPLDVADVLAAVVNAADEEALRLEKRPVDLALREGYLRRFWDWMTRTEVDLSGAQFALPDGASLVVEMKTRPTLRKKVREIVANHLSSFLREVNRELLAIEARVQARGKAGLVIVVDSLEKLRGTSTSWHDVLNSAEQLFAGGAPYLRLPVHTVYTIPPALVSRRVDRVHFMPMIKLKAQDGTPWPPGARAARELVRRRIPDEHLIALLGPEMERRLDTIIRWSGGYPRELVEMLQKIVGHARHPISEADLTRLLHEVRDSYRLVVPAEAFEWLAKVALEKFLTLEDDEQRPAADLMLSNSVILCYLNDQKWFDLHPAALEIPGIQEALQRLRAP